MKKTFKNEIGITLIALIITIIVMLILVAVSIQVVINSGLLESASEAGKKYKAAAEEEANMSKINIAGTEYNSIEEYLNESNPSDKPVIPEEPKLPEIGAGEKANTPSKYQTATIPAGFTVSGVPTENTIDGGLVIYLIPDGESVDWTDGTAVANAQKIYDQFVWIPTTVNDMFICQAKQSTDGICNITLDANGKPECQAHKGTDAEKAKLMAGRLYATGTGETFDVTLTNQAYTVNSELREPDIVTGNATGDGIDYDNKADYLEQLNAILGTSYVTTTDASHTETVEKDFKAALQSDYNTIAKSIIKNQGFWVGRYETSGMVDTNTNATVKTVAGTTTGIGSVSWYIMYAEQKKYAENKGLTTVTSSMIQGAAHDQVLKFVNAGTRPNGASYDVKAKNNVAHGSAQGITGVYETGNTNYPTGATVQYNDLSKNIYDLEGNFNEWTTEARSTSGRVFRGGHYNLSDSASCRSSDNSKNSYTHRR